MGFNKTDDESCDEIFQEKVTKKKYTLELLTTSSRNYSFKCLDCDFAVIVNTSSRSEAVTEALYQHDIFHSKISDKGCDADNFELR